MPGLRRKLSLTNRGTAKSQASRLELRAVFEVRDVASAMTMACATDGNHGRSVAHGAQLVGAKAAMFVHSGVREERVAAIAEFGAQMMADIFPSPIPLHTQSPS